METVALARPATTGAATSAIQRKATDHPPLTVRNARLASLVVVIVAGPKEGPRDAPIATLMATVQRARPVTQKQAINATQARLTQHPTACPVTLPTLIIVAKVLAPTMATMVAGTVQHIL